MDEKRGLKIVFYISIIAIILFAYLINVHYKPSQSRFCDISEDISCDIVNKSLYSEIFGIPVSVLGALTFLAVLWLSWMLLRKHATKSEFLSHSNLLKMILVIAVVSTIFSLWLIYAELYLILSICLLCVVADVLILAMLYVSLQLNKRKINKQLYWSGVSLFVIVSIIVLYLVYRIVIEL